MNTSDFELKTAALDDAEKARLLLCMVRYEASGEEMALPGREALLWPVFRLEIENEKKAREQDAQEKEAQRARNSENGRLGAKMRWHAEREAASSSDSGAIAEDGGAMAVHGGAMDGHFPDGDREKEKRTKKEKEKETGKSMTTPPKPPENSGAALTRPECGKEEESAAVAEKTEKASRIDAGFDVFWAAYPRHEAKKNAWAAWEKLRPSAELRALMMDKLGRQRASPQWNREGGRFIPLAATWLNGRRWEDETVNFSGAAGKSVSAQNYQQRQYTEEDLNAVSRDLLDEARRRKEVR